MKLTKIALTTVLAIASMAIASEFSSSDHLWYKQPAVLPNTALPWTVVPHATSNLPGKKNGDTWESQTLPVGNGRIGGTVYGGDRLDCVVLNEVSLWSGGLNSPYNGAGYSYGPKSGCDEFGSYQPFANLYVAFEYKGAPSDYTRSLDLRKAEAQTKFRADGHNYKRSCFVSRPDDVMVYTAETDKPGGITANIALTPYHNVTYSKGEGNSIIMKGTLSNGEQFEGRIVVKTKGGKATVEGNMEDVTIAYSGQRDRQYPVWAASRLPYVAVRGADAVEVYVTLATDYKMDHSSSWKGESPTVRNERVLQNIANKTEAQIREAHRKDFASYYDRMKVDFGTSQLGLTESPTDVRLHSYRTRYDRGLKTFDPDLEELLFNYGRYVLISGSQPGNLPVTLQGIWNDKVHAPWACDYHNNINLQMCYWAAEVANLSECHAPLIDFIRAMEAPLSESTRRHFGFNVRGWTTRISQNPWGGGGWVKWNPPVNAWYALHIWDRYMFSQDKEYLRNVAYPLLKNICHFWEDELKAVGAQGKGLQTRQNENSPVKELTVAEHPELAEIKEGALVCPMGWSHEWGPLEDGCAHDQQLIRELFDNTVKAAQILGVDAEWAAELAKKRDRLVGDRIGRDGYLQEWIVDRPNMVKGQRHTSHLIGVFPGSTISMDKTPELAKAAMKSLELRGLTADNRRSWTWPWRTALWARFRNADKAYSMVQHYIRYNVLDNLFGNHPPMQMDGTYGMPGGMSEMLIQSHAGAIELLPAIPAVWEEGSVKGIRARGNITVDMAWKNGKVTSFALTTTTPNPAPVTVLVNGERKQVTPQVK
ncbi:MAG: glycoside hydrolase family 95 protein [Akkermansia sp.]|nr:glycoside hydrolase family 95 protein [Akkermansia sp.]